MEFLLAFLKGTVMGVGAITSLIIVLGIIGSLTRRWFDWMNREAISDLEDRIAILRSNQDYLIQKKDVERLIQSHIDRLNSNASNRLSEIRQTQLNIILDIEKLKGGKTTKKAK